MKRMHGLGQKIYMARKIKKYSQAQLAEKIGKSRAVISAYENDLKTPSGETLIDLSVVLDISLDYLVGFVNRRSIVVEGLSEQQIETLIQLVTEYREGKRYPGFTAHQKQILNDIMGEFGKLPKGRE